MNPLLLSLSIFLILGNTIHAQEVEFKKSSAKIGTGFGFNEGKKEIGQGFVY